MLKIYRFVITDVKNKLVIDILRKRNKYVVNSNLSKLKGIDKFHVVKLANKASEKTRKENRQNVSAKKYRRLMRECYVLLKRREDLNNLNDQIKLQVWIDMFPLLGQAYQLKEQFFDICEAKTVVKAYKLYQESLSNVPKELMVYFDVLI